jgi:hypothetical protein
MTPDWVPTATTSLESALGVALISAKIARPASTGHHVGSGVTHTSGPAKGIPESTRGFRSETQPRRKTVNELLGSDRRVNGYISV